MPRETAHQQDLKRIIGVFILALLVSTSLIAVFHYQSVTKQEMAKLRDNHRHISRLIQDDYNSKLKTLIQKGELISKDPRLQELEAEAFIDPEINGIPFEYDRETRLFISDIKRTDPTISAIFIMAPDGRMYMTEPFETQKNLQKSEFSDRAYYQTLMREKRIVISETFVGADGFETFVVVAPVMDEIGRIQAISGQVYHLSNLDQIFQQELLENMGTGIILDANGELVRLINDTLNLRNEGVALYTQDLKTQYSDQREILLQSVVLNGKPYYLSKTTFENNWTFYLIYDNDVLQGVVYQSFMNQMLFIFAVILLISFLATHRIYIILKRTNESQNLILTNELKRTKEMEIELREKHSLYHQLFEMNASPMLLIDPETLEILDANMEACQFYGISSEAFKATKFNDLSHQPLAAVKAEMDKMRMSNRVLSGSRHHCENGVCRDVEIYSGPVYYNERTVICSVIHDVTDKRQSENEMKKALDYYLTILDDFPTLIWRVNEAGDYDYFNKTWLQYTGCIMDEEVDDGWLENLHSQDVKAYLETFRMAFKKKESFIIEMRLLGADGKYRWMLNRGQPYYDIKGAFNGFIGTCVDIHEIKELELKLVETANKAEEYSRLKDKFLANMSHEVRTPISGIVGITELMLKVESDEKKFDQLNLIRSSAYNLLDLVNDILDLSKIESGNFELNLRIFNLNDLMLGVIKLFDGKIYEKNIDLQFEVDELIPHHLFGDPMRLKQIMVNLVGNALKFTADGYVEIRANLIEKHKEKVNIEIVVSDSGIGISEENRERVFEEFVQDDQTTVARFGGTGLGLSIVRSLVELMGGTVLVNSEVGKGTQVHFNVFLKDYGFDAEYEIDEREDIEEVTRTIEKTDDPLRILIAEDNKINQLFISSLCRDVFGDHVDVVDDGVAALDKVMHHTYDCILLDKNMPGLSGLEVTREIKLMDDKQTIPIILITAAKLVDERESILTSGIDYYLSKPVDQQHLKEILDQIREKRQKEPLVINESPEVKSLEYQFVNRDELMDVSNLLGKGTLLKMIHEFLMGYEQKVEAIRVDLIGTNYEGLREKVHNLKGSIGYFKTRSLLEAVESFEEAIRLENTDLTGRTFSQMTSLMDQLKLELEKIRDEIQGSD